MIQELDTRAGTLVIETSDTEYKDVFIDLKRENGDTMQVCVVTVRPDGSIHIYPYNTGDAADYDDAQDDLVVRTDGDRWYVTADSI